MATLSNMIDETLINLAGYTFQQDRSTYLTAPVTTTTSSSASPLIMSLGSTDSVGKGIVEIDEELLWVDNYDRIANTATVAPYGRGYLGTTAATHTAHTVHTAHTAHTMSLLECLEYSHDGGGSLQLSHCLPDDLLRLFRATLSTTHT